MKYYTILLFLMIGMSMCSLSELVKDDGDCAKVTQILLDHVFKKEPLPPEYDDAYKLLKYSGTAVNDLGDYYACNALSYGQFYTITINLSLITQSIGLCYLKQCSLEYMQKGLYEAYDYISTFVPIIYPKETLIIVNPKERLIEARNKYIIGISVTLSIIGLITIMIIISTIFKHKNLSFLDIEKNSQAIFNVRNPNKTFSYLRIFDGVRFFSAGWIIFGHSFFQSFLYNAKNNLEIYFMATAWYFPIITGAYYAVDVFFFLSGFFVYFSIQHYFNKDISKIKILLISILGRYFRLLPFLLFGIFAITYLIPFIGDGPNYYFLQYFNISCTKYYWHTMLYINNFVKYSTTDINNGMCLGHSWYLACDMQFFVFTVILAIILNNYKMIVHILYGVTFLYSIIWQYIEVYKHDYRYNDVLHPNESTTDYVYLYYNMPLARITPYLLGIYFCELFLHTSVYKKDYSQKNKDIAHCEKEEIHDDEESFLDKINMLIEKNSWVNWILMIIGLGMINVAFWTSSLSNKYLFSTFWSATCNTFNKLLFTGGLGIVIHLTFLDKFVFIRKLLSFKILSTVSRSTYGIYIIHIYYIGVFTLAYNTFYYIKLPDIFILAVGVFVVSWITALVIGLIIESPIISLSKQLLKGDGAPIKNDDKKQVLISSKDNIKD